MAEESLTASRVELPQPQYYRNLDNWSIRESVKDLDHAENLSEFNRLLVSAKTRNFIVDFSDDEAYCGFDLDAEAYTGLLATPRPPELNTRWINIWLPHDQKDVVAAIAKQYDFTPRLLGFMCAPPIRTSRSNQSSRTSSRTSIFHRPRPIRTASGSGSGSGNGDNSSSLGSKRSPPSSTMEDSTSEDAIGLNNLGLSSHQADFNDALNPYTMASETWHYSSVDWGRRYVCLGYNALHNVPHRKDPDDLLADMQRDRPTGKRVWTWLLLCEDKTVITIHEDPYPYRNGNLTHHQHFSLGIIRRNLINVFRQCSKAGHPPNEPAQMKLPLRTRLGETEEETMHRPTDLPGLLYYYLFDDWFNTYGLIARRQHRYANELSRLRREMLVKAELSHVEDLHHIGCQLSTLKRLYVNYESIIDRLLEKQEVSLASLKNSHVLPPTSVPNSPNIHSMASSHIQETEILGVSLSSAARVRFERLRHRIRLYAISEIQECLEQKESLVMMNFNLIAIKESYSVERLTRITLLLAKVTLIFMPVSLMTAYFSCQLKDVEFTAGTYWKWFGGVFGASIAGLFLFSFASGIMEGKIVDKPLSRRIIEVCGRFCRNKGHQEGGMEFEDG